MAGSASSPISVTDAPTIPVAVANTVQVSRVAMSSEPRTRVKASSMLRNSRSSVPARSITYPMNRNSGTEISTSFFMTAENVRCTNRSNTRRAASGSHATDPNP
jgi:hypothetical protein